MDCKTCKTCGVEKPLSEFHKNRKYKNTQYYQSYCKSCFAKKRKEHYQKKDWPFFPIPFSLIIGFGWCVVDLISTNEAFYFNIWKSLFY